MSSAQLPVSSLTPLHIAEMVRKLLLGEEGAEGSICDAMEFLLTAVE